MMRKKIFIYIVLLCLPVGLFAQTDMSMATNWYNRGNYNPASIARTSYLYLFSNYKQQWMGVEGAPTTFNVEASLYNSPTHSAFGLSVVEDKIGLVQALNPMLTYAYRISNDEEGGDWSLAFGLSVGVYHRAIDVSEYSVEDENDDVLYTNADPITNPDANFGAEFQNNHFIAGLSTTHLFSIGKSENLYLNENHRYLYGIYKNTNSESFNYYLGAQLINHSTILVYEGSAVVRFKMPTGLESGSREIFDVGLIYRSTKTLVGLFGFNITPQWRIGYSYQETFESGYYPNGTHEIMLEYRIPLKSSDCEICNRIENNWYR